MLFRSDAIAGGGTVTSVDASGGTTGLTFTGGPITLAGTLTLGGTLAIANGGSGQTTAQDALNAFAGAVTSGYYLRGNGTNVLMSGIQAADVPTLNQNTTGSAGSVANALTIGTGLSGTSYNGSSAVTIAIAATGVTADSYGSASQTLLATVNAQGQLTSLSASNIAIAASQITSGTLPIVKIGRAHV